MIIAFGSLITVDVMRGPDLNDPNIRVLSRNPIYIVLCKRETNE